MNTKELKDKILQLAITGKLVEQDENGIPASELLKEIKLEKERLIKEKKIKKEKPLLEIAEEEKSFELPEGWEWCRLGDIANIVMGQSPDSATVGDNVNGIEFHQGKSSFGKYLIKNSGLYCTKPTKIATSKDVLISVRAPVGTLNITDRELCIGRGLSAIRSIYKIDNVMLYYFINALENELISKATGTTFLAISSSVLKELVIPLPPLEEQKRIVEKVEQLFSLIDELEGNKQDLLEGIKKSREKVLQLAIEGKLVEQNENDTPASILLQEIKLEKERLIKEKKIKKEKSLPEIREEEKYFELPKGWEWCRLTELTSCITCGVASTPNYVQTGKMFLSAKNVKPYKLLIDDYKYISIEDYKKLTKQNRAEINDILLTRVGAGIGEATIVDKDLEFAIYVSLTLIKPIHRYINSKYLLHWINSPQGVSKSIGNTLGNGFSQGNLNVNQVRQFIIPLPPLEEQKRIVAKIDELMEYFDALEKQICS